MGDAATYQGCSCCGCGWQGWCCYELRLQLLWLLLTRLMLLRIKVAVLVVVDTADVATGQGSSCVLLGERTWSAADSRHQTGYHPPEKTFFSNIYMDFLDLDEIGRCSYMWCTLIFLLKIKGVGAGVTLWLNPNIVLLPGAEDSSRRVRTCWWWWWSAWSPRGPAASPSRRSVNWRQGPNNNKF